MPVFTPKGDGSKVGIIPIGAGETSKQEALRRRRMYSATLISTVQRHRHTPCGAVFPQGDFLKVSERRVGRNPPLQG